MQGQPSASDRTGNGQMVRSTEERSQTPVSDLWLSSPNATGDCDLFGIFRTVVEVFSARTPLIDEQPRCRIPGHSL